MAEEMRPFTEASFRQYLSEKKLMGSYCSECNQVHLPPRAFCGDAKLEWREMSGKGKLVAFTVIYIAPQSMIDAGYDRNNPYVTGIVELEEGVRISAFIQGLDAKKPNSITIGMPLTVDFIERGKGDDKQTYLAFRAE